VAKVKYPTIRVTVDLRQKYVELIDEMADAKDTTRSSIVRDIIHEYFRKKGISPYEDKD
jgi:metal-responsive CopG/Arc/MetJ family transcriptional regulator